ncbi:MAG: hypothetical protein R2755_15630 [Acidimicrobiales bacterium]
MPTNTEALVEYLTEGSDSPLDDDMKERAQNSLLEGLGARLYDPTMTEETMNDLVASHLEGSSPPSRSSSPKTSASASPRRSPTISCAMARSNRSSPIRA